MKKILAALALVCAFIPAKSQKKDFEGRLTYEVTTRSKSKDYDDNFYKLLLAANGDRLVVAIKNGMVKQSIGLSDAGIWVSQKDFTLNSETLTRCIFMIIRPILQKLQILLNPTRFPSLPKKNLSGTSLVHMASFRGGENAWMRYLKNNLNGSLGARYVKIPKGEKAASVKVLVSFVVSEDGSISNIEVTNKADINSHLANEAMRVIRESPPWEAATIYGIKTKMPVRQPIVFGVE